MDAAQMEQFQQFQAFMAMQEAAKSGDGEAPKHDRATQRVLDNMPKRATATAAKVATITRNLDPVEVVVSEDLAFRVVVPSYALKNPPKYGARVIPVVGKSQQRSLTIGIMDALEDANVRKQVRAAIEQVNKQAKLADHAPAEAVAS